MDQSLAPLAVKSGLQICNGILARLARRPHAGVACFDVKFAVADRSTATLYASIAGFTGESSNTGEFSCSLQHRCASLAFALPVGVVFSLPALDLIGSTPARRRRTVDAVVAAAAAAGSGLAARRGGITFARDRSITLIAVVSVYASCVSIIGDDAMCLCRVQARQVHPPVSVISARPSKLRWAHVTSRRTKIAELAPAPILSGPGSTTPPSLSLACVDTASVATSRSTASAAGTREQGTAEHPPPTARIFDL